MTKSLFSPIKVGNVLLKNRIVMPAMHLNYTPDGSVTDRLITFYEERAKGGGALIIVGGCIIDDLSGEKSMIDISDDKFIPGLKRLTDKVHEHGACIAAQLYHAGRYANSDGHLFSIGHQPLAPSAIPSRFARENPKEMTKDDVREVINHYRQAAERAQKAGFDAVEIIGSAGYLIAQFLSPVTNIRNDEYGGNPEKRMRFGLEVVQAVRVAVGKYFPILIRLSGNDFIPGGNTNKETRLFAIELEKCGVDAFNITGGWHETKVPQINMEVPRGAFAYLARGVKRVVSKPVIVCNRLCDPVIADELISQGSADMVGIARGLLADPEMPKKILEGRSEEITPCIGCNQGCFDHVFDLQPIECLVNPRAGHELDFPETAKAAIKKQVMVIGGGPGGLSAARTAAMAGHNVVLYEAADQLGGQLHLAGALEGRQEFLTYVEVLINQAKRAGVLIHTGTRVDEKLVERNKPDVVVIATGGEPIKPGIPGVNNDHVVQAWDVLAGKVDLGKEVVVIGGGAVGVEVATFIAKKGTIDAQTLQFLFLNKAEDVDTLMELSTSGIKKVILVEMLDKLARDTGRSSRWVALQMLYRYGVQTMTKTLVKEITSEGVIVEQDGENKFVRCDTVVLALGTRSVNPLEEKLKGLVDQVVVIGDAKQPRKAYEAVREGFWEARNI
ncbi:MAG: FAD-dependent oxidoreductase [Desulfobaccales bacterium]